MRRPGRCIGWCLTAMVVAGAIPLAAAAAQRNRAGGQAAGGADANGGLLARFQQLKEAVLEIATEQQKSKVEEIFAKAMEKLQAIRKDLEQNPDQRQQVGQRLMEAVQEMRSQANEIFTPDQREKLQQKLQSLFPRMAGAAGAMGGMRPGQVLQRLREHMGELSLSDEQKQKLQDLQTSLSEQMQKLRDELQNNRQEAMPKLRQFMQQTQEKIKAILSPEQWDKLQEKLQADGIKPPAAPAKPEAK